MKLRHALIMFALLLAPKAFADGADVYTVANVAVDATAANAAAARQEARAKGERDAYANLLDRITLAPDQAKLPPVTEPLLESLISGFEVSGERTSGVRYLAKLTYHFRADAVRKMLRDAQVPYCDTPSKPVLILAVFEGSGGTPVLWEDPNPWRDAWVQHPPRAGLIPLVYPNGDLEDLQAIDAASALSGDPAKLQAISARYQNADVLVTDAALDSDASPHTLTIKTVRYWLGLGLPPEPSVKTYAAVGDESDSDLYAAAVAGTDGALEDAWKQGNMLNFSQSAVLTATVPTGALDNFVAIEAALAQVPAIEKSELLSLDRSNAKLAIHYYGSPDQLRLALAQRDLTLGGQDPDWTIERRAAAHP
jgi:hypothetical protein